MIARPGKFRFVYEKPYKQTSLATARPSGCTTRIWNQVTVRKLGDTVSEQPLALLL